MKKKCVLSHRYKIINKIGEGGMVNVYLSYDMQKNQLVTIKIIRMDFQGSLKAKRHFKYEKLAINRLNSDHIVKVYDLNTFGDVQYLVTEYVDGVDLKKYIKKHYPLSIDQVITIMSQIIDAVNEAHCHGIIHRDLKPQNILIDKAGIVKITDFGIALMTDQIQLTQTNSVVGSIHYISPEQVIGGKVTFKSDIYSLGIILYELLAGDVPFDSESPLNIAMKHAKTELPSIRKQNPNVNQALENVAIKATAKRPEDRYSSVIDMKQALLSSIDKDNEAKLYFTLHKLDDLDDGKTKILHLKDLKQSLTEERQNPDKYKLVKLLSLICAFLCFISVIFIFFSFTFFSRVNIPNVSGLDINHAKLQIKKHHLIVSKIKYRNSISISPNHAIKTEPGIGKRMINHSGITLVVSSGYDRSMVPNYVGKPITIAENHLRKLGFTVHKIYVYHEKAKSGSIITQSIKAGSLLKNVKRNMIVTVATSRYQFTISNLIGMDLNQLKEYADNHYLNLKYNYVSSPIKPVGKVYRQEPIGGTKMTSDSTLEVWLSNGIVK
jgi:eukaryotic-like serine/threonine-protein kinase